MEKNTNYLVVEVHNAYAVALDNSGRFIKAANCGYEVGDVVGSIIPMIYPQDKKRRKNNIVRLAASLAACICLCAFGGYEYRYMFMEYGSVYMQINPDVEITLSRSGRVLDIEGRNADGTELVKDYEYKGKDKETVVDELADLAIEKQYLTESGRISVEVDARSDEWAERMEKEITEELNRYLMEQGITIEITIGPAEDEEDSNSKEILEESQSVTITIPGTSDDSAATADDDSDDGITDYSAPVESSPAPSGSTPAPVESAPALSGSSTAPPSSDQSPSSVTQNDSEYDSDGNSPYESQENSSYSDSYYSGAESSSDYDDNDDDDD